MTISTLTVRAYAGVSSKVRALHPSRWSTSQRRFLMWEIVACLVITPVAIVGFTHLQKNYWIGFDPSEMSCLPWRIAFVEKLSSATDAITMDEQLPVVIAAKGMAPYIPDGTLIAKLIVGRPGDVVLINKSGVSVTAAKDGVTRVVGHIDANAIRRADDKRGIPAGLSSRTEDMFYRTVTVGFDEVFLMGVQPTSQDGRYFGARKFADIKGVVRFVI